MRSNQASRRPCALDIDCDLGGVATVANAGAGSARELFYRLGRDRAWVWADATASVQGIRLFEQRPWKPIVTIAAEGESGGRRASLEKCPPGLVGARQRAQRRQRTDVHIIVDLLPRTRSRMGLSAWLPLPSPRHEQRHPQRRAPTT